MYYGHYEETGKYDGFFLSEIHGDNIPIPNIKLTEEEWQQALTGDWRVINGKHTYYPHTLTLEELKQQKLIEITSVRNATERAGILYMDKMFDTNSDSLIRISIAAQSARNAIMADEEWTIDWVSGATATTFTANEFLGLFDAITARNNRIFEISRELKERVEMATTKEELDEIQWPEVI